VNDLSKFVTDRNLVLYLQEEQMPDGIVVRYETVFWCEAADKEYARYIAKALNAHREEIFNGSK